MGDVVRRRRLPAGGRGYNAIETGVIFTAATLGVLVSSLGAERLAKRRRSGRFDHGRLRGHRGRDRAACWRSWVHRAAWSPRARALAAADRPGNWASMLTPSVNLVQSSFTERPAGRDLRALAQHLQLGSSFGTAVGGARILVSDLGSGETRPMRH
jgi:hypothetical protein